VGGQIGKKFVRGRSYKVSSLVPNPNRKQSPNKKDLIKNTFFSFQAMPRSFFANFVPVFGQLWEDSFN
jgi:hypothetical protein